jgi:hypothetical protein
MEFSGPTLYPGVRRFSDRKGFSVRRYVLTLATAAVVGVLLAACGGSKKQTSQQTQTPQARRALAKTSVAAQLRRTGGFITQGSPSTQGLVANARTGLSEQGREREPDLATILAAQYKLRAYPRTVVTFARAQASRQAFRQLPLKLTGLPAANAKSSLRLTSSWQEAGPTVAQALPKPFSVSGDRAAPVSGRVIAIATGSKCAPGACRLWIGLAGGGVFRTDDALAAPPRWTSVSKGLTSSTVGSLAVDPSDPSGNTLYAGTGEANSGADSEAGTGLFKTTNGGNTWSLVPASAAFAHDRAISGIAVDPRDPKKIYVSTATSLHGGSAVEGGEDVAPGAPPKGVYETTDGGATFTQIFSATARIQGAPGTLSITQLALDPNDPDTVYASALARGLYRRSPGLDGDTAFHRIFATMGGTLDDPGRPQFALADRGTTTRIYIGDNSPSAAYKEGEPGLAELFRVDDANVPAARLLSAAGANVGWKLLSSRNIANPGFDSFRYCGAFCWYANVVASPPGRPDSVVLAAGFDYPGAQNGRHNGRALLLSTDAGVHFTDLSADAKVPPDSIHPDLHALGFAPTNPDVIFVGGDGGLVRTSGAYAKLSASCAKRGLVPANLAQCRRMLARVPTNVVNMNPGLATMLFQSISTSAANGEILAGAQDNGTWGYSPTAGWKQIAGGDGGQSGIGRGSVRIHTYYQTGIEVNFHGGQPGRWDAIDVPLRNSAEAVSFYMPLVVDARVPGSLFVGLQHVWRTPNYGGPAGPLDNSCGELGFASGNVPCGNWKPLGADLTGFGFGADRSGLYVAAIRRAPSDAKTLWAATVPGRVFVSKNANAAARLVKFSRVDLRTTGSAKGTPGRFVSGIVVDPADPDHAWISYSGYDAYTPGDQAGHVFEVRFNPASGKATWTNRSYDLGDQPITGLERDPANGDLYAASDFGVLRLPAGATAWTEAATGLPVVAVFGLTLSGDGKTLYAATHGRGAWTLKLH